jgi:hypothetical protein
MAMTREDWERVKMQTESMQKQQEINAAINSMILSKADEEIAKLPAAKKKAV